MEEDKKEVFTLYKLINYKSTIIRNNLIVFILIFSIIIAPLLTHLLFNINLLTIFIGVSIVVTYVSLPNRYKIIEWRSESTNSMGTIVKLSSFKYENMVFYHTKLTKNVDNVDLYDMNYELINTIPYYHYTDSNMVIIEKCKKIIDELIWNSVSGKPGRMKDGRKILIMHKGDLDKYYISYLNYENYYGKIVTEETTNSNTIKYCKDNMNLVVDNIYLSKDIEPDGKHRVYRDDITICWYNTCRIIFDLKTKTLKTD